MTTYTANRGLPKPEGTDLISQGYDAIGDLADAVDTLLADSGWVTPTLLNGWTAHADTSYGSGPQYRKVGQLVALRGLTLSGTVGAAIFNLPVGYRPAVRLIVPAVATQTVNTGAASTGTAHTHPVTVTAAVLLNVFSDGNVYVTAPTLNAPWVSLGGVSFMVG